jgi:hypothetical protein
MIYLIIWLHKLLQKINIISDLIIKNIILNKKKTS